MRPADQTASSPVLVVEDEALLRMLLVDELEEAGFRVIEASTGDEGLRELDRNPDLLAVLTDVEMPGSVDGMALARITNERYPKAAVIIMSGRVRPGVADLSPHTRFFGKPFQHVDVISALHDLMQRSAS